MVKEFQSRIDDFLGDTPEPARSALLRELVMLEAYYRRARGEGCQPQEYQDSVLPPRVHARLAVEEASTFGWERYVGASGRIIGMKTFGASAPLKELQRHFGFEPDHVVAAAKELIGRK